MIFPEPDGTYDYKAKPNGVVVKFDKGFKANTTYTMNFRNGIKDLNERNNAKNLKLIFSTGEKIDSLSIEGKVTDLFNNRIVNEATVALYEITDSLDIRKTKPTYFYKTDTSGIYKFENTKKGNYKMYAYLDRNNNLRYDPKNELVAFYKDTLKLTKNIAGLNFSIYMIDTLKPKVQKPLPRPDEYSVLYSEGIKKAKIKFENPADSLPYIQEVKSIKFYNFPTKTDTIKVNITVTDSANNVFTHIQKVKFRETEKTTKKKKVEPLKFETKPKSGEDLEKTFTYKFMFDVPITNFDKTKIKIVSDTIKKEEVLDKELVWNLTKNELILTKTVSANREIKLETAKGTFISIKGDSSMLLTNKHKILNPEDYGLFEGKIDGGKENKIIQLLDENYNKVQEIQSVDKFLFKNIKPGIYFVRVIIDTNGNGEWDFGSLAKEILPEKIFITEKPFPIKANFELRGQVISIKTESVNSK